MRVRLSWSLSIMLMAVLLLAACVAPTAPAATDGGAAQPAEIVGPQETFVYGIGADPTNLDPHSTVDGLSLLTMGRCYDRLVELAPGVPEPGQPLQVLPDAAESWEVSDDGLEYTFTLRPGLLFADGSPLNAEAVRWSFDRLMAVNKAAAANIRQLETVEVVDELTVKMTLSQPFAYFLPVLGNYQASIINPAVEQFIENDDNAEGWLANNCMGSGPYVLTEWRRGERVTLDYNPNWYGAEPSLKRVILTVIPESSNLKLQLERGDLDFIAPISIPEMLTMEGRPGVRVMEVPSMLLILAYLNNEKPPLDDVRVRQAMNYAIDYDSIIDQLIQGKGRRLRGPIAYGMEGYDDQLVGYDYDLDKARELLAEAGYPDGFELTLTYSSQGAPGADDVALAAQANLAEVGIRVTIEQVAEPTRRERIDRSEFVWSVGGWSPTVPIPTFTMDAWYLCERRGISANRAFYCNEEVDALVKEAPTLLDGDARISNFQTAQRIVVEDAPYILFYQANQLLAMRDNIEGLEIKPGGSHYLNYERLSKR